MRTGGTAWLVPALVGAALATIMISRCEAEDAASAGNRAVQSAVRDARDSVFRTRHTAMPLRNPHPVGRRTRPK
jgi:hypothetical protein